MLSNGAMRRKKALGMASRLEPTHGSFSLSGRLVRILRPIIQTFVLPVFNTNQDLALGCTVADKFVGDDHTRHVLAALEDLPEKRLRCGFVTAALDQDIQQDVSERSSRPIR